MFSYHFLINRTIFVRETSFQQVLLSSSGPKENHRCFTLRCLGEKVVPVSIKLKSQVRTPKGLQIIRKAEVSLLNERIRSINNTINMLEIEHDTCMKRLSDKLKKEDLQE